MNPSNFQPLIFHGLHPEQPYMQAQVRTYSAGPKDDSMRICLDFKGPLLPFKEGDVIGQIDPKTMEVVLSDEFKEATAGGPTMTDDLVTPINVEHQSLFEALPDMPITDGEREDAPENLFAMFSEEAERKILMGNPTMHLIGIRGASDRDDADLLVSTRDPLLYSAHLKINPDVEVPPYGVVGAFNSLTGETQFDPEFVMGVVTQVANSFMSPNPLRPVKVHKTQPFYRPRAQKSKYARKKGKRKAGRH